MPKCSYITYYQHCLLIFTSLRYTLMFSGSNIHNEQKHHYHLLLILFFILYSHVLRFVMFPTAREQQHCLPALTSNGPSSGRSEQCKAFFTMSSPKRALRLFGRSSLATSYKANVPLYVLLIFTIHPPYPSPPFFYSSSSTILFCFS